MRALYGWSSRRSNVCRKLMRTTGWVVFGFVFWFMGLFGCWLSVGKRKINDIWRFLFFPEWVKTVLNFFQMVSSSTFTLDIRGISICSVWLWSKAYLQENRLILYYPPDCDISLCCGCFCLSVPNFEWLCENKSFTLWFLLLRITTGKEKRRLLCVEFWRGSLSNMDSSCTILWSLHFVW